MIYYMFKIAREIQNIEDRDADYTNNKKWKKLRDIQNIIYREMAISKIKELSRDKNIKEENKHKIIELESFLLK